MSGLGMSAFAIELAAKVRGLIAESDDVNATKIADAIGRSQGYVSPKMNGKEPWDAAELAVIATLLDMSPVEFLTEVMRRGTWLADSVSPLSAINSEARTQSRR